MSLLAQLNLSGGAAAPARGRSELSAELFEQFRDFIYRETGIYFQDHKKYLLESRVGRRVATLGQPDYRAYFDHLRSIGARTEMPHLINAITINETFFFRNPAQFDALEADVLPDLIARRMQDGSRRLRIWSAACSTGDEPYTLALMLRERLAPRHPQMRFEVIGTDINTEVLDTARAGVYGPYAVRNIPPNYLRSYFTQDGDAYTLSPEIRRMVTFKRLNLMDRMGMQMMRGIDLILCANVLIYFDEDSKKQVISSFYNSLNPGGYLLVGFSETLYGVTQAFQPVRYAKTIAYKKG